MSGKKDLTLTPLGGVGEVGRSCFLYECHDNLLVVDCGIMPRSQEEKVKFELEGDEDPAWKIPHLPKLEVLDRARKGKQVSAVITHAHLDHIGAIDELAKRRIPIRTSSFTKEFFTTRLLGENDVSPAFISYPEGGYCFQKGNFDVECFSVPHSIPGTLGVVLKAGKKTIVHLSDFKFNGLEESQSSFEKVLRGIRKDYGKIDCLALDVLNADMEGFTPPENQAIQTIQEIIQGTPRGRIFITFFSSNIQRLGEILKVCKKLHRSVRILGRGMKTSRELLKTNGEDTHTNRKPWLKQPNYPNEVILLAGCQGEENSHIWRSLIGGWTTPDGKFVQSRARIEPNDTIIFSSRCIPGNEEPLKTLMDALHSRRARIILHQGEKEKIGLSFKVEEKFVHVSGHGQQGDILKVIEVLQPKKIVPVHATSDMTAIMAGLLGQDSKKLVDLLTGETLKI